MADRRTQFNLSKKIFVSLHPVGREWNEAGRFCPPSHALLAFFSGVSLSFFLSGLPLCSAEMSPCVYRLSKRTPVCLLCGLPLLLSLDPHRGQDDLEKHRSDSIGLNYLLGRLLPSCPSVSALGFSRQASGSEALHMWFLLPGMLFPPVTAWFPYLI